MKLYYRLHFKDSPEFSSKNAYSLPWGQWQWVGTPCDFCDPESPAENCILCQGTGFVTPREGYSCFETLEDLVRYFNGSARPHWKELIENGEAEIYEFNAAWINPLRGADGEPLVVPGDYVKKLTVEEILKESSQG